MARRAGWLIALLAALAPAAAAAPRAEQPSPFEREVDGWVREVEGHAYGTFDAPARRIAALPWTALRPILDRILGRRDDRLLLRFAAILTDVAVHVPLEQRPRSPDDGKAIIAQDGERRGIGWLDPHLSASRRLVDRLVRETTSPGHGEMRSHAIAWYRTVSAWLAWRLNLADLGPHVRRSLELFADDAGVQFDAACYFETFASPQLQASMAADEPARPSRRRPRELMDEYATSRGNLLALAEKHFRRALELDPGFVEARVRLGRVLALRDRPQEAVVELRKAGGAAADRQVEYFNALFLAGALEQTGDPVNAAEAFEAAAGMFPRAQSPQLALSRLAASRGNQAAAWALVDRMLSAGTDEQDPWWIYHRASGRDADAILRSFADRVRAATATGPPRDTP